MLWREVESTFLGENEQLLEFVDFIWLTYLLVTIYQTDKKRQKLNANEYNVLNNVVDKIEL